MEVSIEKLREAKEAYDAAFPVGTRVILNGLGAGWANLNTLSGVVVRLTDDPLWSHVVRVEYPMLVPAGDPIFSEEEGSSAHQEYIARYETVDPLLAPVPWGNTTTVHGSALVLPEHVSAATAPLINNRLGLNPSEEDLQWARWLRMWGWVGLFSEQDLSEKQRHERLGK